MHSSVTRGAQNIFYFYIIFFPASITRQNFVYNIKNNIYFIIRLFYCYCFCQHHTSKPDSCVSLFQQVLGVAAGVMVGVAAAVVVAAGAAFLRLENQMLRG